jgi:hypothetical protein
MRARPEIAVPQNLAEAGATKRGLGKAQLSVLSESPCRALCLAAVLIYVEAAAAIESSI